MIAWSTWAHVVARPVINGVVHHGYPYDLSWNGPWWVQHVTLPHVAPLVVLPAALALLGFVYLVANTVWDRLGEMEKKARTSRNVRR
jgi:hypothetical protein